MEEDFQTARYLSRVANGRIKRGPVVDELLRQGFLYEKDGCLTVSHKGARLLLQKGQSWLR